MVFNSWHNFYLRGVTKLNIMKSISLFTAISLLYVTAIFAQTPKVGITNFSVSGYQQSMNVASDNEPELYFIGDGSTLLEGGVRVSDEIVKYTEASLKTFLGRDIIATAIDRPSTVPNQMMGRLFIMETITDKKAFKQLGYDEVIEIQCRIGSAGRSGKYYKPFIEINIKITDKDGKTVWKKKEKLKLEEKIAASAIEMNNKNSGLSISFSKNNEGDPQGITAAQLLDWYKQVLGNALIKEDK
jgi:hypothetical protein